MSEIKIDYELWAEYRRAYDALNADAKVASLADELTEAKKHLTFTFAGCRPRAEVG